MPNGRSVLQHENIETEINFGQSMRHVVSALGVHLRSDMVYPVFAKPVTDLRSVGVAGLHTYDLKTDALIMQDGQAVAVDDFLRDVDVYRGDGYLF